MEGPQFCGELSFTLSLLFLSASNTAPTYKGTIISLEACGLNADFQHFIPRSNKFPYFMDTPDRRVWGERRPKNRVTLQLILVFTLIFTCPKTFTRGRVSVCDIYLHWPHVSFKKRLKCKCNKIWTCKCKWFTLKLDLHTINYWHLHAQHWFSPLTAILTQSKKQFRLLNWSSHKIKEPVNKLTLTSYA